VTNLRYVGMAVYYFRFLPVTLSVSLALYDALHSSVIPQVKLRSLNQVSPISRPGNLSSRLQLISR
jgi:hypothetical protein